MSNYVHDENHNRIPAYSAEQVLSVLAQAIEDGDLDNITADAAFITRLKSITDGKTYFVSFLTQAEYNALVQAEELQENTIYYITDDSTLSDLQTAFVTFQTTVNVEIADINNTISTMQGKINERGSSLPIQYNSSGSYHYAVPTKSGLYACIIHIAEQSTGNAQYYTIMLSIDNVRGDTETYQGILCDRRYVTDLVVTYTPIVGKIILKNEAIDHSDFSLYACHLITPYE